MLRTGKETEGYIRGPGKLVYYRAEPIRSSAGKLVGAFILGRQGHSWRLAEAAVTRRNRILATTSALVMVLSLLILLIIRRNVSLPIQGLIERIQEIGKGNWEKRIDVQGRDEVTRLAQEFNHMCEQLEQSYTRLVKEQQEKLKLERELRHSERLASVGQLAAGLAHEIGTPLSIIGGRAEHLLRKPRGAEELSDNLKTIRSQIDRIARIVRQLLEFSRHKEPSFRLIRLASVLTRVNMLFQHEVDERGATVELKLPADAPMIEADPDLLEQVFINLYRNALHGLDSGGKILVRAETAYEEVPMEGPTVPGLRLRVTFEDNGPGILPEHLGKVFDPFFTTKDVGEGTGLGLSVAYGIIRDHGGEIRVESEPGKFARFIVDFPVFAGSSRDALPEIRQ
jgi:signal transduction histidine kinase